MRILAFIGTTSLATFAWLFSAISLPNSTLAAIVHTSDKAASAPFDSFMDAHDRHYSRGSEEYERRRKIFEHRLASVQQHNSLPHRLWDAAVNHLSDRTDAELSQLRGLRAIRTAQPSSASLRVVGSHYRGQGMAQMENASIPEEKFWTHLHAVKKEVSQGECGSCWALSTAIMLQANAEINGYNRSFSAQELVSCVPNPQHCGGAGGCKGSTSELAMSWIMDRGLDTEGSTPYKAYSGTDGRCKKQVTSFMAKSGIENRRLEDMTAVGFHASGKKGSALGIYGWERLPQNEYEPLMRAVALVGPVVVAVGAENWPEYGHGIYADCSRDIVIDHAVTLVGYGKQKGILGVQKFWTIKNSWGHWWGEGGNIRLLRQDGVAHCGVDHAPSEGLGCDGGPPSVKVCGMCGILFDSVVAHFRQNQP